jgi:tetratricopeptide (TPR) repeat protein
MQHTAFAINGSPAPVSTLLEDAIRFCRAGAYEEALRRLQALLAVPGALAPAERSVALRHCADARRGQSRWAEGLEFAVAAVLAAEQSADTDLCAEARNAEGAIYHAQGKLEEARVRYTAALACGPSTRVRGILHQNLGTLAALQRDYAAATESFAVSLEAFREAGYLRGIITAQINAGWVLIEQRQYEAALVLLTQARGEALAEEDWDLYAEAAMNFAQAQFGRGDFESALAATVEVLGHFTNGSNVRRQAECYHLLGQIHVRQGDTEAARALLHRGLILARNVGATIEVNEIEGALSAL